MCAAFKIFFGLQAFCFSRRRETQRLRQQFVPMYSVEHEENEWGSQLVEEDSSRHLHIVKVSTHFSSPQDLKVTASPPEQPDRRSQARMLLERSSPL